ncbi:GNAT family N-acetyltransferase [Sphingomonas sp. HITSZ_GF]|uniref:GNAT family N-acetyltransferase n=1 Tax=Sphingomonas sp. HITSZ_GF TaxID=3037247 RepID=UPI00240E8884|nr:GNAT family N-acetyltransferase [Sphingomonas sp. HITSZ_GF]MDG2535596.1 GNAT family N-acetyltransferase [Sphingomonas sp. HITSZ_GF]
MSSTLNMVELREGGSQDLTSVNTIMQEAFDPRYGEAWTSAQCLGMLSLPGVWLVMASIDGRDAGFALSRIIAGEAELLLLATHPVARRRGVAGALLRAVIDEARGNKADRVHLEVRSGNDAVRLYRREGFEKVGERREYYRGRNGHLFDAHTYARDLD